MCRRSPTSSPARACRGATTAQSSSSPGSVRAMHCPECGFVNAEGANYCQKCGAFLGDVAGETGDTTIAYQVGETGEHTPVDVERVAAEGAALVIRAGGGRAGESFTIEGEQTRVGRSPEAEVSLDDVTGSRNPRPHGRRPDRPVLDDLGSPD